jgi:hypothetical protein
LGYGSGSSSIRDENSSANLLSLEISNEMHLNTNVNALTIDENKLKQNKVQISYTPKSLKLKPLDKLDLNNASQVSIDTRIKYTNESDLIPLVPVESSVSLSTSGLNNNTLQIPMCQIEESENTNEERERWYTIFLQVLFPFLIAGLGMVAAGVVLDKVQV